MQSEECGNRAGIEPGEEHRYALFRLAGALPAPAWRNGLSLAFPPSDVAAVEGSAVTPGCIGLLGMAGTLPYAYTEAVARVVFGSLALAVVAAFVLRGALSLHVGARLTRLSEAIRAALTRRLAQFYLSCPYQQFTSRRNPNSTNCGAWPKRR